MAVNAARPKRKAWRQDNTIAEIENAARLSLWPRKYLVSTGNKKFLEEKIIFADHSIFDIFTIPFLAGDHKTALKEPFCIVITKNIARKYFGEQNPVGKFLRFEVWKRDFKITGVVDNCPTNSHFKYKIIASLISSRSSRNPSWRSHNCFTYISLRKGSSASQLEAKFPAFVRRYWGAQYFKETGQTYDEFIKSGENFYGFFLQPLLDIHLNANITDQLSVKGNINSIFIFFTIAIFILLLACINFMNLSTARFSSRSREVGIRKILGSSKKQLIFQFMGESTLLSLTALFLAILIIKAVLPVFSHLSSRELEFNLFSNFYLFPALLGFAILVGIMAGSYPAFFLSSFPVIQNIRNSVNKKIKGYIPLRRVLVILQFSLSIILIISTLLMTRQMDFLRTIELGFNTEHVVVIDSGGFGVGIGSEARQRLLQNYRRQASQYSAIQSISVGNMVFCKGRSGTGFEYNGENINCGTFTVDYDFIKTLKIELLQGRDFSPEFPSDEKESIVVNESFVKAVGLKEPVGQKISTGNFFVDGTIIGVVEDFHQQSLHHEILPAAFKLREGNGHLRFIVVRIGPENVSSTLELLENTLIMK